MSTGKLATASHLARREVQYWSTEELRPGTEYAAEDSLEEYSGFEAPSACGIGGDV